MGDGVFGNGRGGGCCDKVSCCPGWPPRVSR